MIGKNGTINRRVNYIHTWLSTQVTRMLLLGGRGAAASSTPRPASHRALVTLTIHEAQHGTLSALDPSYLDHRDRRVVVYSTLQNYWLHPISLSP
jgi:hypothetical protein